MKSFSITITLLLLFNSLNAQKIEDFPYWLTGIWEIDTEFGKSYEEWEKYNDNTLIGKTYKVIDNDTLFLDIMKIEFHDKEITLEMSVFLNNSQTKVKYKLEKTDPDLWKFVNPDIDFPFSVNYLRTSENSVYLWTEAKDNNIYCTDFIMIRQNE